VSLGVHFPNRFADRPDLTTLGSAYQECEAQGPEALSLIAATAQNMSYPGRAEPAWV